MSAPQVNENLKAAEGANQQGGRGGRGGRRGGGGSRGRGGNNNQQQPENSTNTTNNKPADNVPAAKTEDRKPREGGSRRGGRGGNGEGGRGGRRGGRGGANNNNNRKDDAYDDDDEEQSGAPSKYGNRPVRMTRLPLVKRNTEDFEPSHAPADMRVVVDTNTIAFKSGPITVRDVVSAPMIFSKPGDADLYDRLVKEIEGCKVPQERLLKSWHGDSHWIADDKTGWKKSCPTFVEVCDRMADFFKMDVKATRFNWYKDTSEWKPFHHDAAAVKADKARTQNFTVAASFGATRDAAFEHAKTRQVISFPQPSGTVYCFARDTNIIWRHGILQEPKEKQREEGRISIILWGIVNQDEVD